MIKDKPLFAIFLTVFLDMLSFGTVIPDIQLRAEHLVKGTSWITAAGPNVVGIVIGISIALFSIAQFIISPYLGRLSDEKGRRPILLVTCTLAVISSLLYAFSTSLPIMWLSRICHGFAGANLGVAYAYIADISSDANRAKSMGVLGMAFGLGFMFGPPLGAILIEVNNGQPFLLGLVSAGFALINLIFVARYLPESNNNHVARTPQKRIQVLLDALKTPTLGSLLLLFFVANLAFANLESTYFRLGADVYKISQTQTSLVLVFVGVIAALVQGGLIRVLEPKFGEVNLLRVGYLVQAPVLASIPFVKPWWPVLLGCAFLGTGNGIAQPSLSSLISKNSPPELRGSTFGITQSLGSLARIIGPIIANTMYAGGPARPYLLAALLMLIPSIGVWRVKFSTQPLSEPEPTPVS